MWKFLWPVLQNHPRRGRVFRQNCVSLFPIQTRCTYVNLGLIGNKTGQRKRTYRCSWSSVIPTCSLTIKKSTLRNTRRPNPRSLTHFGEWKDPCDSVVAISQFVVSWISLTNFANIENSAGSIAQSTQLLKMTLPKSCTIGILEHFRSMVDNSTLCFLVAMPGDWV